MLIESASRPTTRSSVPHQGQDLHKALADLALYPLRSAEIAAGPSSPTDHASKAGYTFCSAKGRRASRLFGALQRETESRLTAAASMIQGSALPSMVRPAGAGGRSFRNR
jgi:hypothetical protein